MSELTYDQIMFKASHNSYERTIKPISKQLDFNAAKPYDLGCMSLELDIWRHSSNFEPGKQIDEGYFTVNHLTPGNTTLSYHLKDLMKWHNNNRNHYVILITLGAILRLLTGAGVILGRELWSIGHRRSVVGDRGVSKLEVKVEVEVAQPQTRASPKMEMASEQRIQ